MNIINLTTKKKLIIYLKLKNENNKYYKLFK